MASKKTSIKDNILAAHLINGSHDFKSVGGLLVSGVVSTFGIYSIILPFFTDEEVVNSSSLTITLIAFVVLLIIVDTIKRGSLTKYFNSLLKRKILKTSSKKGYLVVSTFTILFMVLLDSLGAYATAEKGATLYSQSKTNSSTEFKILQQNAETGKATASNYTLELSTWKENKKEAHSNCVDKWKGWKSKYKANCKSEWNEANPMPKQTADGQIKISDYKAIKNDNRGFLDRWLFSILFVLLGGITLLMQYLTIAKIHDDKNDIEDSLNDDRIEFIKDDISEHEAIQAEHEQEVAKVIVDSTKRQKGLDKDFKEVGEAIVITHKKKRNETRGKTVMRIANNEYVPHEESKAGHVHNPFANVKGLNNEDEILKKFDDAIKKEEGDEDIFIFNKLWLTKSTATENERMKNANEKLNPKSKVINTSKRGEMQRLSKVYKIMRELGIAELRGNKGYFSLMDYDKAYIIFEKEV